MIDATPKVRPLTRPEILSLTLGKAQEMALSLLAEAAADTQSPLRVAVLATQSEEGPDARSVILRNMGANPLTLTLWSDSRSNKLRQMAERPEVALVLYDPRREIQLRLKGKAEREGDATIIDATWQGATVSARRAYLAAAAPGASLEAPHAALPDHLDNALPSEAEVEAGRGNFAILNIRIDEIDLLILGRNGHRRAVFFPRSDAMTGHWLVP